MGLPGTASASVGDDNDPHLIVTGHDRVLGYGASVERDNYLEGIDPAFYEQRSDRAGITGHMAGFAIRQV